MHSTLLLATFALSTLATPIARPLNSRMDIHGCYRANSRSEHSYGTRSSEPKRVCKISHPRDIDDETHDEDADAHHIALSNRRSAQPESTFRGGSGRREVGPDDRVIIKTRNPINKETQGAGRTQARSAEAEPNARLKNRKRQPSNSVNSASPDSQQSSGKGGGYLRPAQKRTAEAESDAYRIDEDEVDSETLAIEANNEQDDFGESEDKHNAESLPSDESMLTERGAGRTQARGAGRTQARNADPENQSVEEQVESRAIRNEGRDAELRPESRAIRNEGRDAEPQPVIRPIHPGGTPGNRGGKGSNKRAVKGPGGGSQCHPGTWSSRC